MTPKSSPKKYTEDDLSAFTIAELRAFAEENEMTIKATKKADIIAEILSQL